MKTNKDRNPESQKKKQEMPGTVNSNKSRRDNPQETQEQSGENSSPYVDLDKANFKQRPYDRPASLGPDHEPKIGV